MPLAEDTLTEVYNRQKHYQFLHAQMASVSAVYNNRARVALPDAAEDSNPTVPNLLAQGIDQLASRIASVTPMPIFASAKPGQRTADRRAATAARVINGWWAETSMPVKMPRRARHLIAYGLTAVTVSYDPEEHVPSWHVRDPKTTFPAIDLHPGKVCEDVAFSYKRSGAWLASHGYGWALEKIGQRDSVARATLLYTLIEHVTEDYRVLVLAGADGGISQDYLTPFQGPLPMGASAVVLEYVEGKAAPKAFVATRLALDEVSGQFDTMLGMYALQARLMALEEIAVEKGIFPDTYLISRAGEVGRFLDGPHDGRTGKVNVIAGGDIRELTTQPGYQTNGMIDRLERAQRLTGGIPAEFGGESGSNIRTGRRGDAVLSAVIDFPVAEAQTILAKTLEEENEAAIGLARFFDNGAERTLYQFVGNDLRAVKYVADQVFEDTYEHVIAYPVTGADLNSLMIGLGQRVGMGTMSKETAAYIDPFIDNPELEHDRIIAEGLEQSLVAGLQQQAASGAIPPLVLGKIMTLVRNDKMELAEAMVKVTEDAQKEAEAAKQQEAPPTAEQAMAGPAAAAMTGNPEAASPIPGETPGQGSLASLLSTLRKPVMAIEPMRGAERGAM